MLESLKKARISGRIVLLMVTVLVILYLGIEYNLNDDQLKRVWRNNQQKYSVELLNPFHKNGTHFKGMREYNHFLRNLSNETVDYSISQYKVSGINFLPQRAKRRFLRCDPEVIIGNPAHTVNTCTEIGFRSSGERVALASFPGSGSTWSRTLLEQATGIYTGSVYCDASLKSAGFLGEHIATGNVIAIKTHLLKRQFDSTIFIVRNIADAIQAEINRRASHNHTGLADENLPTIYIKKFGSVKDFIYEISQRYVETLEVWLNITTANVPTIVVRYEDMLRDTRGQLRRMLDFLKYPYTEDRLDCVLNHQIQTFHRQHHRNFDPFTSEQKRNFVRIMKQVEPLLNLYNTSYRDIIDM